MLRSRPAGRPLSHEVSSLESQPLHEGLTTRDVSSKRRRVNWKRTFWIFISIFTLLSTTAFIFKVKNGDSRVANKNNEATVRLSDRSLTDQLYMIPLRYLGIDLGELNSETIKQLHSAREGNSLFRPDSTHLHGLLGYNDLGVRGWQSGSSSSLDSSSGGNIRGVSQSTISNELQFAVDSDNSNLDYFAEYSFDEFDSCVNSATDIPNYQITVIIPIDEPVMISVLLRTIHSVLNRTPPQHLKEILVIQNGHVPYISKNNVLEILKHVHEDNSTGVFHDGGAEASLKSYLKLLPQNKIRFQQLPEKLSTVELRQTATSFVTSQVTAFLDHYVLMPPRWTDTLFQMLQKKPGSIISFPLELYSDNSRPEFLGCRGGIDLALNPVVNVESSDHISPSSPWEVPSPIIFGNSFASMTKTFTEIFSLSSSFGLPLSPTIHSTDTSLSAWMCHDGIFCTKCLTASIPFGGRLMSFPNSARQQETSRGKLLLMAKWFDEFGKDIWSLNGQPDVNPSDVDSLIKSSKYKNEHQCKSLQWFRDSIFSEFPLRSDHDIIHKGVLKNEAGQCIRNEFSEIDDAVVAVAKNCSNLNKPQLFAFLESAGKIVPVGQPEISLGKSSRGSASDPRQYSYLEQYIKGDPDSNDGDSNEDNNAIVRAEPKNRKSGGQSPPSASGMNWALSSKGHLQSMNDGLCLSVADGSKGTSSHGLLTLEKCSFDKPRQLWKFEADESSSDKNVPWVKSTVAEVDADDALHVFDDDDRNRRRVENRKKSQMGKQMKPSRIGKLEDDSIAEKSPPRRSDAKVFDEDDDKEAAGVNEVEMFDNRKNHKRVPVQYGHKYGRDEDDDEVDDEGMRNHMQHAFNNNIEDDLDNQPVDNDVPNYKFERQEEDEVNLKEDREHPSENRKNKIIKNNKNNNKEDPEEKVNNADDGLPEQLDSDENALHMNDEGKEKENEKEKEKENENEMKFEKGDPDENFKPKQGQLLKAWMGEQGLEVNTENGHSSEINKTNVQIVVDREVAMKKRKSISEIEENEEAKVLNDKDSEI